MTSGALALRLEGVGKRYRVGQRQGYNTLRESLTAAFRRRGALSPGRRGSPDDSFWALHDVSFEVQQGEVLGILGPNGAGKSTLLKILSRVTKPSAGRAEVYGRVGSLLEVGTGFHPELTGRENVYLNGAILGMTRSEVDRKFDEMVAFAEVDQFLDTPVKRYSSGMYLRLAFAVAAHLEPDILVVDEVLAVGDAHFQKKCRSKMREAASSEGRTVLLVSHNTEVIAPLCSRCLLLDRGRLVADGDSASVVRQYLGDGPIEHAGAWIDLAAARRSGTGEARFAALRYFRSHDPERRVPYPDEPLEFQLLIESDTDRLVPSLAVFISDPSGIKLVNADTITLGRPVHLRKGRTTLGLRIRNLHLNPGSYAVGLFLADPFRSGSRDGAFDYVEAACRMDVAADGPLGDLRGQGSLVTRDFEVMDGT